MRKLNHVEARVAQVLAEVPVDDRHEREAILAQLRENYAELEFVQSWNERTGSQAV